MNAVTRPAASTTDGAPRASATVAPPAANSRTALASFVTTVSGTDSGPVASLTTDRVEWAAAQSGDELAAAAADFYRAGELIATADSDTAWRFLDGARSRIPTDSTTRPGALNGQLHLKSGLAAARQGDISTTDAHVAEAAKLAATVAEDRNDYDLAVNRHNVAVWSVGLAVEAMHGAKALDRARAVRPAHLVSVRTSRSPLDRPHPWSPSLR